MKHSISMSTKEAFIRRVRNWHQ